MLIDGLRSLSSIHISHPDPPIQLLVLTSRSLASLELIQVPPTDSQTTLVLIHTPAEARNILRARPGLRLRACVDLVLALKLGALGRGLGRRAAAAAEPAADGMTDRGSDGDTAGEC